MIWGQQAKRKGTGMSDGVHLIWKEAIKWIKGQLSITLIANGFYHLVSVARKRIYYIYTCKALREVKVIAKSHVSMVTNIEDIVEKTLPESAAPPASQLHWSGSYVWQNSPSVSTDSGCNLTALRHPELPLNMIYVEWLSTGMWTHTGVERDVSSGWKLAWGLVPLIKWKFSGELKMNLRPFVLM